MAEYIGLDEVGRGALAGPVFVAAVTLPENPAFIIQEILTEANVAILKDSKRFSPAARERIYQALKFRVSYAFGYASVEEINNVGIIEAIRLAAGRALRIIVPERPDPELVLVRADAGLFHPFEELLPTERFVKGDEKYPEIALASIIAKVERDKYMQELGIQYPMYGFETSAGYGTAKHIKALKKYGATDVHRKLFIRKALA